MFIAWELTKRSISSTLMPQLMCPIAAFGKPSILQQ